ncbi:hypothetical protein EGW08_023408 [Elysia chlorotica]|uniref:Uncharacterized protein n=1 Tax=Elysia chlorotica TaxID=188477 RepID=A0A3S1AQ60_ELYCH|nr:hypothetical protein EGW08_023408 [Elysia chlorotica]
MDRAKIYASVWQHLFKLTPRLQDGLGRFVDELYLAKDTLVKQDTDFSKYPLPFLSRWHQVEGTTHTLPPERKGKHVRYTLVCGQFRLKRNPTMPNDNLPHDHLDVRAIWDFLQSYNDSRRYRIYVATDSEDIRSQAKRAFPDTLLDIPGPILHSDLAGERKDLCQGIAKVLLDQLALASCDVLVRGYKSHLGAVAAYWRGQDARLYCFNASTVEPCAMSDRGFHWGPDYTPGASDHWETFITEIQRKASRMSLEEEEEERRRRRQRRKAVVMKHVVRDEREVVMRDGGMLPL